MPKLIPKVEDKSMCHQQDNLWDRFQIGEHVAYRKYKSHSAESGPQYVAVQKLIEYSQSFF